MAKVPFYIASLPTTPAYVFPPSITTPLRLPVRSLLGQQKHTRFASVFTFVSAVRKFTCFSPSQLGKKRATLQNTATLSSQRRNIMQAANHLRTAFANGKQTMGMWQMIPGANVSRILASSGVDWVMVDCEHGNMDDRAMHDAVPAIAALGVSPIVRIPDMQSWMVKRALDAGAHGILVPLLRTADEARELVQSAKFPPLGKRGFGSPIALSRFTPVPSFTEYLQQANDALLTMVQIETKEALEAVEEIAAVPGVDVLFIGPFDLGNNIGQPILNGVVPDPLKAAIAKILAAAHKAGKKCGMYCANGQQARESAAQGFDMINVATDYTSLQALVAEEFSVASSLAKPERGVSY